MIRVELVKLVRRPRTWASILLLCALPTVVAVFIAVTHVAPAPGQGPALLSAVLSNGTLYPAAAPALVLPIFLPIAVSFMAGDAIAGEATSNGVSPSRASTSWCFWPQRGRISRPRTSPAELGLFGPVALAGPESCLEPAAGAQALHDSRHHAALSPQ